MAFTINFVFVLLEYKLIKLDIHLAYKISSVIFFISLRYKVFSIQLSISLFYYNTIVQANKLFFQHL